MSGPIVVVDTSIIVGSLNPQEPSHESCSLALRLAHRGKFHPILSTITVAEVCVGYFQADDELGRHEFLDHVRGGGVYEVSPFDLDLAETAARVRAKTGLRLPDAVIVACGIQTGATFVVTYDEKFEKARSLIEPITAAALIKRLEG
jgi:predicted nucleic acid-binding protein